MKMSIFALPAAFAALTLAAAPATAQSRNCAPRDTVIKRLAEKYGESRQSIGVGQKGMVMETFASGKTGSWTITVTTPNGMTCLVASGQSYEVLAEALPDTDSDA
ncbi:MULTISPECIES: hypothetical protein [unclassified Leisingera]|uniref:hypothetical protein n=1 Tax=unclassified Leisingera TaxID=2614906 RepID=UPI0010110B6D|nr:MULTISPECIES: hypothetical protein [unclassified Leisingera]MCF6430806.1 hypothetical protein [Leisingera sp. MMG026]QAX28628.1 hypothetical protein ETW24_04115 [Leisingera sp. NJS204]